MAMERVQELGSLLLAQDGSATMEVADPEQNATALLINEIVVHNHTYSYIVVTAETNVAALAATLTDCGHDHSSGTSGNDDYCGGNAFSKYQGETDIFSMTPGCRYMTRDCDSESIAAWDQEHSGSHSPVARWVRILCKLASTNSDGKSIAIFLVANVFFTLTEFLLGVWHSDTEMVGSSFHTVTKCFVLSFGMVAIHASSRPRTTSFSYGYGRLQVGNTKCLGDTSEYLGK